MKSGRGRPRKKSKVVVIDPPAEPEDERENANEPFIGAIGLGNWGGDPPQASGGWSGGPTKKKKKRQSALDLLEISVPDLNCQNLADLHLDTAAVEATSPVSASFDSDANEGGGGGGAGDVGTPEPNCQALANLHIATPMSTVGANAATAPVPTKKKSTGRGRPRKQNDGGWGGGAVAGSFGTSKKQAGGGGSGGGDVAGSAEPSSSYLSGRGSPEPTPIRATGRTADWDSFLEKSWHLYFIPPVKSFKHAPLTDQWDDLAQVGVMIEVPNPFVRTQRPVYWYAKVAFFAGYKAFVQFENLGIKTTYGAWISFFSDIPKPLGWCKENQVLMHPPEGVSSEKHDWLGLARLKLQGAKTIRDDHVDVIRNLLKETQKYPLGTLLEVMDSACPHRMRLAFVNAKVGDRIHVKFCVEDSKVDEKGKPILDPGFWFNVNSEHVHPLGWSQTVGVDLVGAVSDMEFIDLPDDHFPKYPQEVALEVGQMLEARHPHHPNEFAAARVEKVLKHGYFIASFYTRHEAENCPAKFIFHVTSTYILPCGFSHHYKIPLVPPRGEAAGNFHWEKYLVEKDLYPAKLQLIPEPASAEGNRFKSGHKLEACCCVHPYYMGPATVRRFCEHLLFISFDGWPRNPMTSTTSDLWIDAWSHDIYPIGYAALVGHEFQGKVEPPLYSKHQVEKLKESRPGPSKNKNGIGKSKKRNGMACFFFHKKKLFC